MNERTIGILFALATAAFWGLYGVALGKARGPDWSPFKPYVFIGVAYLVWGVIAGLAAMWVLRDSFSFTGKYLPSMKWGFIAGSLGAFGALTLTYAMFRARNAGLVMPIVFGGAVSVTAVANLLLLRMSGGSHGPTNPLLWVGMLLVAAGIVLVARHTPHIVPGKPAAVHAQAAPVVSPAERPVDAT